MVTGSVEVYLWLGMVGALLVLLSVAFGYLLVVRRREWLRARFQHDYVRRLDAWLGRHVPALWRFFKARFSPKAWYGLLLTLSSAVFLALVVVFAGIAESWREEEAFHRLDRQVNAALLGALSDEAVAFLRVITHFGDTVTAVCLIVVLALVFLYKRRKWHLVALLLLEGLGAPFLTLLKYAFSRTRPDSPFIPDAEGYSFPSGHSFTAMVLYGFLIFVTWRYTRRDAVRIPVTVALALLILLIALSRVVLSVHWVSDVLGGLTIGLAWLLFTLLLTRALRAYSEPGAPL